MKTTLAFAALSLWAVSPVRAQSGFSAAEFFTADPTVPRRPGLPERLEFRDKKASANELSDFLKDAVLMASLTCSGHMVTERTSIERFNILDGYYRESAMFVFQAGALQRYLVRSRASLNAGYDAPARRAEARCWAPGISFDEAEGVLTISCPRVWIDFKLRLAEIAQTGERVLINDSAAHDEYYRDLCPAGERPLVVYWSPPPV